MSSDTPLESGRAALAAALDAAGVRRGSARAVGMKEVASRMGLASADVLCERVGQGTLNADDVAARIQERLAELTDAEINERASEDMASVVASLLETPPVSDAEPPPARRIRVKRATPDVAPPAASQAPAGVSTRRATLIAAGCALLGGGAAFLAAYALLGENAAPQVVGLQEGKITARSLDAGAVTSAAMAAEAVTEGAIAPGAVTAAALADGAVAEPAAIAPGAVGPGALAAGAVTQGALGTGVVGLDALAPAVRNQIGRSRVRSVVRQSRFANAQATISCQTGETALAGGASAQRPLAASAPLADNGKPATGWRVTLVDPARLATTPPAPPLPNGGTIWVICTR